MDVCVQDIGLGTIVRITTVSGQIKDDLYSKVQKVLKFTFSSIFLYLSFSSFSVYFRLSILCASPRSSTFCPFPPGSDLTGIVYFSCYQVHNKNDSLLRSINSSHWCPARCRPHITKIKCLCEGL